MTNQQILNETYLNPKWFWIKERDAAWKDYKVSQITITDKDSFSQNHHLVYLSDNIKNNCFIKDVFADDVRDCPNCGRQYETRKRVAEITR